MKERVVALFTRAAPYRKVLGEATGLRNGVVTESDRGGAASALGCAVDLDRPIQVSPVTVTTSNSARA